MHPRHKLRKYLFFDVCATLLAICFVWFWALLYYQDFRPPDMAGISHSISQLQREISYISLWCLGWAVIAASANFIIVRRVGHVLDWNTNVSKKWAYCSALLHLFIVLAPAVVMASNFWVLHTTFNP